ncbi:MAG: CRTAC1 family protein [Bacteroidota bacterium]
MNTSLCSKRLCNRGLGSRLLILFALCGWAWCLSAQPVFSDISTSAGGDLNGFYRGVSIADYDLDGWEDIIFTGLNGATTLLRNEGNMTFTDQTARLNLGSSEAYGCALWVDYDNDGDSDLLLGGRNQNSRLLRNEDGLAFTDVSNQAGIAGSSRVYSLNAADIDSDGFTDIYITEFLGPNRLYYNKGDGTFSEQAGARNMLDPQLSMGSIFTDYNQDGHIDLYLTHDGDQPNIMLRNNGSGFFTDVSQATATDFAGQGMGVDVADLDADGWLDIYITNLYDNTLLRNLSGQVFLDRSFASGTNDIGMGWGTNLFDTNQDGFMDIYVANETGFSVGGISYPNILYLGQDGLEYTTADPSLGDHASTQGSYGSAVADLDNDGDLDLVLANSSSGSGTCQILRNDTPQFGNWLQVSLKGVVSPRDAAGARVVIHTPDHTWIDEHHLGSGFASQSGSILHFGLGDASIINELVVYWPSGQVDSLGSFTPNQRLTVTEGGSIISSTSEPELANNRVVVWPNPATDWVKVEGIDGPFEYEWLDVMGRVLEQGRVAQSEQLILLPNGKGKGMLFLRVGGVLMRVVVD